MADANAFAGFSCPIPRPPREAVLLGHGSGGRLSAELLREGSPLAAEMVGPIGRNQQAGIRTLQAARDAGASDAELEKSRQFERQIVAETAQTDDSESS